MTDEREHFHDCPYGDGGKHRCVDPKCKPEDHDEPPLKGEPYHGLAAPTKDELGREHYKYCSAVGWPCPLGCERFTATKDELGREEQDDA